MNTRERCWRPCRGYRPRRELRARRHAYTFCVRLTPHQQETIRQTVLAVAGAGASVRLFGLRVDDRLRGGDIDLLVELDHPVSQPVLISARLAAQLQRALGEQRIDVIIAAPNVVEQPIHRVARAQSVEL